MEKRVPKNSAMSKALGLFPVSLGLIPSILNGLQVEDIVSKTSTFNDWKQLQGAQKLHDLINQVQRKRQKTSFKNRKYQTEEPHEQRCIYQRRQHEETVRQHF